MDIECNQVWRNDQYDTQFDELKERYDSLAMEIPKKDLKKLPQEWLFGKITFDPAYAWVFYAYTENPQWTACCLLDEWFILDIEYEKFKELRLQSLKEEEESNDSDTTDEQETQEIINTVFNQSSESQNS